jgi:hypothetical protein
MAFLYEGAGRLTAKNGGFRPGQWAPKLSHQCRIDIPPSARRFQVGARLSLSWHRSVQ